MKASTRDTKPQTVIEGRERQHLQAIRHAGHAGRALDDALQVLLLVRLADLAGQLHVSSVHSQIHVIPDAVTGVHADLVGGLGRDIRVGVGGRSGHLGLHTRSVQI